MLMNKIAYIIVMGFCLTTAIITFIVFKAKTIDVLYVILILR